MNEVITEEKSGSDTQFEPKILGFLCNWCSYAGADLAGVSRNQYPSNIRVVRLMCSGRVDPVFVMDALIKGVDGVLILGCHFGDCHYGDGNYEANVNYEMLNLLLKNVNIDNRVEINWVSAAEGTYFAKIVTDFTDKIRSLGPSPMAKNNTPKDLQLKMKAIRQVVYDPRVRKLVGRERKITEIGNVYEEKIDKDDFILLLKESLHAEYIRNQILLHLNGEPGSVKDVSEKMKMDTTTIFKHFLFLQQRGIIDVLEIKGFNPIYKVI